MLHRVLVDEAVEVHGEFTGHFGRSTRARAVAEAPRALVSKAMDPLTQGRIGKLEGVRNGVEALPFDDVAHGLSAAKDPGLLCLLHESVQNGQGVLGKVEFERPHRSGLQEKLLQKCIRVPGPLILLAEHAFSTQTSLELLITGIHNLCGMISFGAIGRIHARMPRAASLSRTREMRDGMCYHLNA
jgi:hypothetical protein